MNRILLIGAEGGLGSELFLSLSYIARVTPAKFDVRLGDEIARFILQQPDNFDGVVYAAGVNHIKEFDAVGSEFFESVDVNCFGFVRVLQELREQKKLTPSAKVCIVTSNAANIPMTHSLSYNCSKAAANMAIRQIAREIPVDQMCIFGVAPNKLHGTNMSRAIESKVCEMRGWTPEEAEAYQLKALPAHVETPPMAVANFIRKLLSSHCPYIHGTIIPYGGPQ